MQFKMCDKCITVLNKTSDIPNLDLVVEPWTWVVICDGRVIAGGSAVCSSIADEEARRASILYHGVKFEEENPGELEISNGIP
jgi:hypothetical protein